MTHRIWIAGAVAIFAAITTAPALADSAMHDYRSVAAPLQSVPDAAAAQAKDCAAIVPADTALAACDAAIASGHWANKDLSWAYVDRGIVHVHLHQHDLALADFDRGIALDPDSALAHSWRGEVYLMSGQPKSALADYNDAIRLNPQDWMSYGDRGEVHMAQEEYQSAIADLTNALAIENKLAIEGDKRKLQSTLCQIYINLGRALAAMGKDEDARAYYKTAVSVASAFINITGGDAEMFHLRGDAYISLGLFPRALEDYSSAVQSDPDDARLYSVRSNIFLNLHEFAKAVADMDNAIRLRPGQADFYNGRCWTRAVWGQGYDLALADCNESLKLHPDSAAALDSRGFLHLRMGDNKAAIADDTAAIAADPEMSAPLYVRGLAKHRSGDTAGGDADIAAAKAIDPKIAKTYADYGVTL